MSKIISIYPKAMPKVTLPFSEYGKRGNFQRSMEPGSSERPAIIDVPENLFEMTYIGEGKGQIGTLNNGQIQTPVANVAQCLVNQWIGNMVGTELGDMPGVWVVQEGDGVPSMEEQIETHRVSQYNYWRHMFDKGQELHSKKLEIPEGCREAARHLNEKPEWLIAPKPVVRIDCPYCGSPMPEDKPICKTCQNIVNRPLYDQLQAKGGKPPIAPHFPKQAQQEAAAR